MDNKDLAGMMAENDRHDHPEKQQQQFAREMEWEMNDSSRVAEYYAANYQRIAWLITEFGVTLALVIADFPPGQIDKKHISDAQNLLERAKEFINFKIDNNG